VKCYSEDIQATLWAASSAGRAPRSQRGGRGFESHAVHQLSHSISNIQLYLFPKSAACRTPADPSTIAEDRRLAAPSGSVAAPFRVWSRRDIDSTTRSAFTGNPCRSDRRLSLPSENSAAFKTHSWNSRRAAQPFPPYDSVRTGPAYSRVPDLYSGCCSICGADFDAWRCRPGTRWLLETLLSSCR
jgi:hypothetical protein